MSTDCPTPGEWLAAALRPAAPDDRTRLTAHMSGCKRCRTLFEVLRSLGRGAASEPHTGDSRTDACADGDTLDRLAAPDESLAALETLDHVGACAGCLTRLDRRMVDVRVARENAIPTSAPRRRTWWPRGWPWARK